MGLKLPFSFSPYIFLSADFVSPNQIKYWYKEVSTLKKVHDFCHDILSSIDCESSVTEISYPQNTNNNHQEEEKQL